MKARSLALLLSAAFVFSSFAQGADWPAWRGGADRSASSGEQLPAELHLQWSRQLPQLTPAWPEDVRLQFDANYEPIAAGNRLFVSSPREDSVTAYDTATGDQVWKFFAEGPVRFAPVAYDGRIYFGADDGCLYCLQAATGKLAWKFQAAPAARRVLGNERLVSVWPVRGGPVLIDGTIYFTAGVWPFEGTLLYSLDISDPARRDELPRHAVTSLGEFAPQGYLAASGERLFLPGGRSNARSINRTTGKTASLSYSAKGTTDYHLSVSDQWFFHGGKVVDLVSGKTSPVPATRPVASGGRIYFAAKGKAHAYDLKNLRKVETKDRRGMTVEIEVPRLLWSLEDQPVDLVHAQSGQRLYAHHESQVLAIDVPADGGQPRVSWQASVDGAPASMLTANGQLYVTTLAGKIYCFGAKQGSPQTHPLEDRPLAEASPESRRQVSQILESADSPEGYAVVLGLKSGELLHELLRQSDLQVIAVDSDAEQVDRLRRQYASLGLYGARLAIHQGDPAAFALPPYLASLVTSEESSELGVGPRSGAAPHAWSVLRPYGGSLCLQLDAASHQAFDVATAALPGAVISRTGELTVLKRAGALPGSADWTHEYGDAANTLRSHDKLVKAPLGVLWFGGPSSDGSLFYDRHDWGPSMAVIEGRMFLQGPNKMTAVDVYTGRLLWQNVLPGGVSPGRRANWAPAGFHFIALKDAIYLAFPDKCLRLDPKTGEQLGEVNLPDIEGKWGRIRVWKDLLIVQAFYEVEGHGSQPTQLFAFNRHSGEVVWTKKSDQAFPIVAIGGDRLFCVEGQLEGLYKGADRSRRNGSPDSNHFLYVKSLDVDTGKEFWSRTVGRAPSWLAYSEEADVLLASNKSGIDAWDGSKGEEIWSKEANGVGFRGHPENYYGRVILWKDQVIDQRGPGKAYNITTGADVMRTHPLTGEETPWEFTKVGHHCNYAIASEHLLTFRAADAGFCDLATGGTGRLTGFRSGCRNSLIPANGVLNAPNMAHGCSCSFSIFTSLALVHTPESDLWTYGAFEASTAAIQRVGINFGAGGDRTDKAGTTWLDYPNVGGPSATATVTVKGDGQRLFRLHSQQIAGDSAHGWVAASGVEGVETVDISLGEQIGDKSGTFTVRLVFAEPLPDAAAGDRTFDVALNGKPVLTDFDISTAACGGRQVVVREFEHIQAGERLNIGFTAKNGLPLICGVEIVRE
ncbi:outer membrane protein assembly factor BamB family protein [Lignipirellula cremea]|uniref:Serine/threonine-protein kinase AfsK n=1 Tax=Lignipirellula cremea TaxID=2528010 RepID=A0A518DP38_9BACT|nr:PQQ-binding-like beta-propeller repeat protein [Lignipirellula cremea]QDU93602.1 Serine/threonine-protein kinase AfsK [Lignipirellula cremea]